MLDYNKQFTYIAGQNPETSLYPGKETLTSM